MRSFPNERWAPDAVYDGFLAASDTTQYMRLVDRNRGGWRWPHVSGTSLQTWAADDTIAVPTGARYQMEFFGMSRVKFNTVKRVLIHHGFIFHRGKISALREICLLSRHHAEAVQCPYSEA
jgi:hypothetical protein